MEFVDLYDENRAFTGEKIVRGEPIEKGKYKLSVHMWITNSKEQIYIQKRASSRKIFPNKWENPGGGVVSGQDSETTLRKEFEEELGIDFCGEYALISTIRREKDFVDIYHVRQEFELEKLNLQTEEVGEAKWASIEEIQTMINKGVFCPTILDSFAPFLEYWNNNS